MRKRFIRFIKYKDYIILALFTVSAAAAATAAAVIFFNMRKSSEISKKIEVLEQKQKEYFDQNLKRSESIDDQLRIVVEQQKRMISSRPRKRLLKKSWKAGRKLRSMSVKARRLQTNSSISLTRRLRLTT